jgi:serine/threonine protein kinase
MSLLGEGTYGTVSKCIHIPSGTIVAVKTYKMGVRLINV